MPDESSSRRTRRASGRSAALWPSAWLAVALVAAKAAHWSAPQLDRAEPVGVGTRPRGQRLRRRALRRSASSSSPRRCWLRRPGGPGPSAVLYRRPGRLRRRLRDLRGGEHPDLRVPALAPHLPAPLPRRRHGQHALVARQLPERAPRGGVRGRASSLYLLGLCGHEPRVPASSNATRGPPRGSRGDAGPGGRPPRAPGGRGTLEGPLRSPDRREPALGARSRRTSRSSSGDGPCRPPRPSPPSTCATSRCRPEPATRARVPPGARPKNVVFVILESTGTRYLSLYGSRYKTTPVLDAEASHALVFDNFYSHVGMTANSMAAITLVDLPLHDLARVHGRVSRLPRQRASRTC